jgi:hypothetical protein
MRKAIPSLSYPILLFFFLLFLFSTSKKGNPLSHIPTSSRKTK